MIEIAWLWYWILPSCDTICTSILLLFSLQKPREGLKFVFSSPFVLARTGTGLSRKKVRPSRDDSNYRSLGTWRDSEIGKETSPIAAFATLLFVL